MPKDWFKAENLTMFPPEKDLQVGVLWWEGGVYLETVWLILPLGFW